MSVFHTNILFIEQMHFFGGDPHFNFQPQTQDELIWIIAYKPYGSSQLCALTSFFWRKGRKCIYFFLAKEEDCDFVSIITNIGAYQYQNIDFANVVLVPKRIVERTQLMNKDFLFSSQFLSVQFKTLQIPMKIIPASSYLTFLPSFRHKKTEQKD